MAFNCPFIEHSFLFRSLSSRFPPEVQNSRPLLSLVAFYDACGLTCWGVVWLLWVCDGYFGSEDAEHHVALHHVEIPADDGPRVLDQQEDFVHLKVHSQQFYVKMRRLVLEAKRRNIKHFVEKEIKPILEITVYYCTSIPPNTSVSLK